MSRNSGPGTSTRSGAASPSISARAIAAAPRSDTKRSRSVFRAPPGASVNVTSWASSAKLGSPVNVFSSRTAKRVVCIWPRRCNVSSTAGLNGSPADPAVTVHCPSAPRPSVRELPFCETTTFTTLDDANRRSRSCAAVSGSCSMSVSRTV